MINFRIYPDVLTPSQVAELLNVCNKKVYQMIKKKEIKSFRLGRQFRIYKQDILCLVS